MLKRILQMFIIVVLVFSFTSSCFAAVPLDDSVSPCYIGTDFANTSFKISSGGTATMRGALAPKNSTVIDKVTVQFVVKNSSGTSIYNKTYTATWNDVYAQYIVQKTYPMPSKGTYIMQATYRCYKNNSLIETIQSDKITKTY